jgi:uncharacterized protein
MIKTAVLNSASNGVGYELAKIHAEKGGNLVLIARSKGKLGEPKNEPWEKQGVAVHVIRKDISRHLLKSLLL